ncbi:MAG: hypothetical protein HY557_07145 [Euryarchaeota archaeon]|nr:hypothetical protein [Euryarchaeota archaeon]
MRVTSGVPGFDALVQGGLPKGAAVIVQGPSGREKDAFLFQFVVEGLRKGGAALVVLSSVSPTTYQNDLRVFGVDVDRAIAENRLKFVDWFSYKEETVHDVEADGPTYKASIDLANVGIAISRAIASLPRDLELRAAVEILSSALSIYDLPNVYTLAQSTKAKLERFGFTSLFVVEKEMHDERTLSSLHQPFDGVVDIERLREGDAIVRKVAVLSLKATAAQLKYVPLEVGPDNLLRIPTVSERERTLHHQEELIRTNPRDPKIWLATARNLNAMGEHERALRCVDAALSIDANDLDAWRFKADVLEALGRRAEADQARVRAAGPTAAPKKEDPMTHLLATVEQRLAVNPRDADALFVKAAAEAKLEDLAGSIATLEVLAKVDEAYPGLWVLKAKLHARRGEREKAKESRLRAQEVERRAERAAVREREGPRVTPEAAPTPKPIFLCPKCDAVVGEDDAKCPSCGVLFETPEKPEGREVRPPPTPPAPPRKGLTNGLVRETQKGVGRTNGLVNGTRGRTNGLVNGTRARGRTNGLVNGTRGRTNGLVNGTRGRTNGLVNGTRGRTNGLVNGTRGRTNGLVNGVGGLRAGLTNGLTNGSGFTNGLGSARLHREAKVARWKLYVIPLLSTLMLLVPLLGPATPSLDLYPIAIDGNASDWNPQAIAAQSPAALANPNVDIVRFGIADNVAYLAFLVEVNGTALRGGGTPPTMDTFRIFLDVDRSASTGYRVSGLGADRMLEISGWNGNVNDGKLYEWDTNRDGSDWRGWIKPTGIQAAVSGALLETQVDWLAVLPEKAPVYAALHARGYDGTEDTAEYVLNSGGGSLLVVQESVAATVLAFPNEPLLGVDLSAHGRDISVSGLRVTLTGSAPFNTVRALRLIDDQGTLLEQRIPIDRRVPFQFAERTIAAGSSSRLLVIAETVATNGLTLGAVVASPADVTTQEAPVSLRQIPSARDVGYIGSPPASPAIDGGYAEWTVATADPAGDVRNPRIDLTGFASMAVGASSHFFLEVSGRLLGGTWVAEGNRLVPQPGPTTQPDQDRDTVPDAVDLFPLDFNNDGIPDTQTNGDYDGDGMTDYGYPGGIDVVLETTIPATFPAPYAGREVRIYIGPTERPPMPREDAVRVFVDLDNSTATGYGIAGLGADRLVEIQGMDGTVASGAAFTFGGASPGEWSWSLQGNVTLSLGYRAMEFAVPESLLGPASRLYVEVSDTLASFDSLGGTRGLVRAPPLTRAAGWDPPRLLDIAGNGVFRLHDTAHSTETACTVNKVASSSLGAGNLKSVTLSSGESACWYVDETTGKTIPAGDWESLLDISSPGSAYQDGASVSVPTTIGAIDSIATSLPAGTNLVIAAIQFDNTAGGNIGILAGDLELRRGTLGSDPLLAENEFRYYVAANGARNDGNFALLIGRDVGAPSSPTYAVRAQATATGVNAEVKFLVLNGVPASSFGDGSSVGIGTSETTLLSHTSSVGAGDNVVIAVVQLDSATGGDQTIAAGNVKLKRSTTTLTSNELAITIRDQTNGEDFPFYVLIARDASAPANPTYDVTALHSATGINGEAKILVFNGLSSAIVDSGSVTVGTTRTQVGQVSTTFAAGDDVLIGSFQIRPSADMTLAASSLEVTRVGGTAFTNQFADRLDSVKPNGLSHIILGKERTTAANATYEGAATAPANSATMELKLVAIHVNDTAATEYDVYFEIWNLNTDTVAETIGSCLNVTTYGDDVRCLVSGVASKTISSTQAARVRIAHSSSSGKVTIEYDATASSGNSRVTLPIPEFSDAFVPVGMVVVAVMVGGRLRRRPKQKGEA